MEINKKKIKHKNIHPTHCRWDFFLYLCSMNVELVEQYLKDKYGNLPLVELRLQDGYILDGLFIYKNEEKKLRWYVDIETDLYAWFGPGNYYKIIHNWFFKQFGKEIGYDK